MSTCGSLPEQLCLVIVLQEPIELLQHCDVLLPQLLPQHGHVPAEHYVQQDLRPRSSNAA